MRTPRVCGNLGTDASAATLCALLACLLACLRTVYHSSEIKALIVYSFDIVPLVAERLFADIIVQAAHS